MNFRFWCVLFEGAICRSVHTGKHGIALYKNQRTETLASPPSFLTLADLFSLFLFFYLYVWWIQTRVSPTIKDLTLHIHPQSP